MSRKFVVKRRHINVRMTSALFKMVDVNVGNLKVNMDLLKRWHPKVCKKKSRVMPNSDPRDRIIYPIHKLMLDFDNLSCAPREVKIIKLSNNALQKILTFIQQKITVYLKYLC